MLQRVYVENFGLIDRCALDVHAGMTVLTGETGAGKSMLIGAIATLFGQKTHVGVRPDTPQAVIETTLALEPQHPAHEWLLEQGFTADLGNEFTIKKLIPAEGHSRSFCNGQRITQQQIQQLSALVLDIHSQTDTQQLRQKRFQMHILDRFGGCEAALNEAQQAYYTWREAAEALQNAQQNADGHAQRLIELEAQVAELEPLIPVLEQLDSLKEEQQRLTHAVQIGEALGAAQAVLNDEQGVLDALGRVARQLDMVADKAPELGDLNNRFSALDNEASDLVRDLQRALEQAQPDPARLDQINQQLSTVSDVARKHRSEVQHLQELFSTIQHELAQHENPAQSMQHLQEAEQKTQQVFATACTKLSKLRVAAKPKLEKAVASALTNLHMASTRFEVQLDTLEQATATGAEQVTFAVAVNPGQPLGRLQDVASGGEVSRLMLALKQVFYANLPPQLVIFDEIDTGISGAVASAAGAALRELGQTQQVLTITHLPQVAASGAQHWNIAKTTKGDTTTTTITELDKSERQQEIARLLAGTETTAAATAAAQELLQGAT